MTVYEAIAEMRRRSREGGSFSFTFMSYSRDRRSSDGVTRVERARLLPGSDPKANRFADHMLNYVDLDTLERRSCWQPLLLELDGEDLELT
ncbi:MAG: hypothetical protein LBN29_11285 [Mediterranea sp.]|jgi:hypothetical protein|nr:hypothetical protein [Mediterranea sp.]